MERDIKKFIIALLCGYIALIFIAIWYANKADKQNEQYKILEATYHADTCDRGYGERRLIEILNDE